MSRKEHRLPSSLPLSVRIALSLLFVSVSVCICAGQPVSSALSSTNKKAIALYNEADLYRVRGQYPQAIALLEESIGKDKRFTEAYLRLGYSYRSARQIEKAKAVFEQGLATATTDNKRKGFYLELGDLNLMQGVYGPARDYLDKYLQLETQNKVLIERSRHLKSKAEYGLAHPPGNQTIVPRALSDTVNCFRMQYFPVLTADEKSLIYTRRLGAGDAHDEDLVISNKDSRGRWSRPVSLSEEINSDFNEGTCAISADGRLLIFTSCQGRRGYGSCDLFQSRKVGDQWSEPENLGSTVNSSAWESQPSLSADGRELYFVSDRKGGVGKRDIWMSRQVGDSWSTPENAGSVVNTPYDEVSPFLHANGQTLFLSSDGHPGYGGFDLFRVEKNDSAWGTVINIGWPINDYQDQYSMFITADSEKAYYSFDKDATGSQSKLMEIELPATYRVRNRSNILQGIVRDKDTGKPLGAHLDLYHLERQKVVNAVTSDSIMGDYLVVLTEGADYGLYVSRPGYLFQSLHFDYSEIRDLESLHLDVTLEKIKPGVNVVLNNIFFATDSYALLTESEAELFRVVEFLSANPRVSIEISGHTDDRGEKAYNKALSQKRAGAVVEFLTLKGIQPGRLMAAGYGVERPTAPNDTDENRQKNRRIEVRILN